MSIEASTPPAGISAEDWAATPQSVRVLVMTLLERLGRLEVRVNPTARNSSKPPSCDSPSVVRPSRPPSERKAGGQGGHVGQGRRVKCSEQVDQVIELRPTAWEHCGALWLGEECHPVRHQVMEIPPSNVSIS